MRTRHLMLALVAVTAWATGLHAAQSSPREALRGLVQHVDRVELAANTRLASEEGLIEGVRCATREVSELERELIDRAIAPAMSAGVTRRTVEIPVVFHVVRKGRRGNVTDGQIERQIDVLNDAYAPHGFAFRLLDVRRYNDKFGRKCLRENVERKFKRRNAVDPARVLNVYTCQPAQGVLGYAWFPSDWDERSFMHGVVLLHSTLPGGGARPYDEGDTAVHEVGHYLGLFHTFDGGCSAGGDAVLDTPGEAEPAYGCPVGRDSCPGDPGVDPIFNFMDYSDDACMDEFTGGQRARMQAQLTTFKPNLGS